jgi:transcriptional regulator with XRE-family HTH domain
LSVKERLKSFIKHEGLSVKAFEESIGASNGYVNSISKGIGKKKLETILEKYPKLNLEWLLTGKIPEDLANEPQDFYTTDALTKRTPHKYAVIISSAHKSGLSNAFYDKLYINKLNKEDLPVNDEASKACDWFKIEISDKAMDNGSKHSLAEGDWAYCRSISKQYWKDGFSISKDKFFCFFHNEHGILFRTISHQDTVSGTLTLKALNPNKNMFPDFKIKVSECSFICNVINVLSEL